MSSTERYAIVQITDLLQFAPVFEYWQRQITHGLLKYRLPDVLNPTMQDVREMIASPGNICFIVWDTEERTVAGEAMLNNFFGGTALMHFSVDPDYRKETALHMAREGLRQIFSLQFSGRHASLLSITGITPVTNRLSVNFLQKIGFSVKGRVDDSFILANYGGKAVDGVLLQLKRGDTEGWDRNKALTTDRPKVTM